MLNAALRRTQRPRALIGRNLLVQKAVPYVWATGLVEPVFYLLSIGVGIGHLVGQLPGPHGTHVPYAAFVAPALLASSAMNGAVYESTTNIFDKLHWAKIYQGVVATPLTPTDIATAEVASAVLRSSIYSGAFLVAMALLSGTRSWWSLLALPCAALIGFAFAAAGFASACYMRSWTDFDKILLVQMPLFLFSATFYPLSVFPRWLQLLVEATPLYQGVATCRELCLGQPSWDLLGHVAYLAALAAAMMALSAWRATKLLTP
ncbi:MAG: ABC transporter permease [Acidimicrobiales bacterium]